MVVDFASLDGPQRYRWMTHAVVPRPIAWILSPNEDGTSNLAPFSYFNAVCSVPPLISVCSGRKRNGDRKDSWRNIEEREFFTVHVVTPDLVEAMNETARALEYGVSEVNSAGLDLEEFPGFSVPRLARAALALACRRERIIELNMGTNALILGEILSLFADESILGESEDRPIDPRKLLPISRLGGNAYARAGEVFELARPQ